VTDPRYVRLLTGADIELLRSAGGGQAAEPLGADPSKLDESLRNPAVFEALFGSASAGDPFISASPFLAFSVLVNRVARDLEHAAFVEEWLGPARTVPVFDVANLREFLADASHRLFLAELLASYTHVASGSVWQRTARGWRRRRYSELDPVRLTQLLEVVPEAQRAGICRRLGDLALFLSGVFPDYVASHPLQPRHVQLIHRLLDATGMDAQTPPPDELARTRSPQQGIWLLEWLGTRAYRLAIRAADTPAGELRDVVDQFGRARRVLNTLTRDYLQPSRERWFPQAQ
jgi:hypothetical protein